MAVIIEVKVIPSSGKFGFVVDKAGLLKCFLKSAPEKGLANKELVKGISKLLGVPQKNVDILTGEIVRNKRIKIETDLEQAEVLKLLGVELQKSLLM
ncbi:MAG: hypothetical protein UR26_C0006G0035 [candidate division TM6 bacterium GW2011_GWF2_32_72]|nr:MAG: hypothetical protein UR26_C0006G0035 [candidate division TM6 bacterium GW2011_GWF2_32_72]